jgi:hypothetical protein
MTDPSEMKSTMEMMPEEGEAATKEDEKKSDDRLKRLVRKLLVLPYILGLLWTCLHPIVSVLTGELKCRGWYIDEHSIDTKFADVTTYEPPKHLKIPMPTRKLGHAQLCDYFNNNSNNSNNNNNTAATNLVCHAHGDSFHVASVVPVSNALEPTEETIVFVVPAPSAGEDWSTSSFHYMLLQTLKRFADPIETPWLAKTFLLVAPTSPEDSLDDTVSLFLDAYLGS